MEKTVDFNSFLEIADRFSVEEQEMLIEIIRNRLLEVKRTQIAANIAQSKIDYALGNVFRGTVAEIMTELKS